MRTRAILTVLSCSVLLGLLSFAPNAHAAMRLELVASGLDRPTFVTAPPGDATRLFVLEKETGDIRIIKNGALLPTPYLHLDVLSDGFEQGLLGLAFHPLYFLNGYFYVLYSAPSGGSILRRYQVGANPDVADPNSGATLIAFVLTQPLHIAGWIGFGPDNNLYVAKGDGGAPHNAQLVGNRLGKILRLDVDGAFPYAIPADNPFAEDPSPSNEFWATGLRNPWRCSFDRLTGDLYVTDVGQDSWEELDFQPAASAGGLNYGWSFFEGHARYNCNDPCDSTGFTLPTYDYSHGGNPFRCSIVGGYVYRGSEVPEAQGRYFFADFCSEQVWSLRVVNGVATDVIDHTPELQPPSPLDLGTISSFGEDANGELYICDLVGGEIFRIRSNPTGVPIGSDGFAGIALAQPTPNPSASSIQVRATLAAPGFARLSVHDAGGRLVRSLADGRLSAGETSFQWDGRDDAGRTAPPGVYFLRLESAGTQTSRKVNLVR